MNIAASPLNARKFASPPTRIGQKAVSAASTDRVELASQAEAKDAGPGWGAALGGVALLGAAVLAAGCTPGGGSGVESVQHTNSSGGGEIDLSKDSNSGVRIDHDAGNGTTFRSDGTVEFDMGNGTKLRTDGTVGYDMGNGTTLNSDGTVDFDMGNGFSINSDGTLHYKF